jgi:hypothetical protein
MTVRLNIRMASALYKRLKRELPPKRISAFINDAVRARLLPDRRTLDEAYKAAAEETWRREVSADWSGTAEDWPT